MAAPVSTASDFSLGTQSAKGTAATTLITGRMKESMLLPGFDELNPGAEHGIGNSSRPTIQKSTSRRTGYMGTFAGTSFAYPLLLGVLLRGLGFKDTPANNTTYHTHVFTIDTRDKAAWLTAIKYIDEGGARFGNRAVDGRVVSLQMVANIKGILSSFQGISLDVNDPLGTETFEDEVDELILGTDGTLVAKIGQTPLVSTIRGLTFSISNPIYTEDHRLFNPSRIDLPQIGVEVTGAMTGIDVDETLYNKLYRNAGVSGSPSLVIPELDLSFKFESVANITGAAVPYSIEVDMPACEARITGFGSSGRNLVRCGIQFNMKDLASDVEPITVTLVNGRATSF